MNSYERIFNLLTEHQFSRGTKAPRMHSTEDLVKKNYTLMKQHRDLVLKTGQPQHPATQKALSAHIAEFLRRKKSRGLESKKGDTK